MARRHGRRRHVMHNVCESKSSAFTTWDAAMAAVSKTPDAVRAYRGDCCGYWHITRYTQDEYAQRMALWGCTDDDADGMVDSSATYEEDDYHEAPDPGTQPRGNPGGPRAATLERSPSGPRAQGSPADVARFAARRRGA